MVLTDANPLYLPQTGDNQLRILNSGILELYQCLGKPTNTTPLTSFTFFDGTTYTQPDLTKISVTINGTGATVTGCSFKLRPEYASPKLRDLRVKGALYLYLNKSVPDNASVVVNNSDHSLWASGMVFSGVKDPNRFSPILHTNQVGYAPSYQKYGFIGYYLGGTGEFPTSGQYTSFSIIDTGNNVVFTGTTSGRPDIGFQYSPTPYQQVIQADFSNFNTSGVYRMKVADLGISYPFVINSRVYTQFAKTQEQGLYNQRCGTGVGLPYSRHVHGVCHALDAIIPTPQSTYPLTGSVWNQITGNAVGTQSGTVPSITGGIANLLYAYQKSGTIHTQGSHHDAGDYSVYLASIPLFVSTLVFAVDNLNCAQFDNLGIPESNNGKSDLLEEAKIEADYLLKIQDTDGGFFWLRRPANRAFETDVSLQGTNLGDQQVMWPKTIYSTAAAVGALAEIGSSPAFIAQFGSAVANTYMTAATNGWTFLMNAFSTYGSPVAAYQYLYSATFDYGTDALAYAAAAMFAATGTSTYYTWLQTFFPDVTNSNTYQFGWKKQVMYFGCAVRAYAFAVKSGRRVTGDMNSTYLTSCQNQCISAAEDVLTDTLNSAYGVCLEFNAKSFAGGLFSWFFPTQKIYDLAVGYQLNSKATYISAIISNLDYIAGCNPLNRCYITGLGQRRFQWHVSQYRLNDKHNYPPNGQLIAAVSFGVPLLQYYLNVDSSNELSILIYPTDGAGTGKYPFYDRETDSWNVSNEETVSLQLVQGLATSLWLSSLI